MIQIKKENDLLDIADGLYDDVAAGGNYVAEFTNWAINPERKAGDAEIVKTEFGYHFMYFVEASDYQAWESDVREAMASNAYNELVDGIYEDIEEKAEKLKTLIFSIDTIKYLMNNIAIESGKFKNSLYSFSAFSSAHMFLGSTSKRSAAKCLLRPGAIL